MCVYMYVCGVEWSACAHVLVEAQVQSKELLRHCLLFSDGILSGLELAIWYRLVRPERTTCPHLPSSGITRVQYTATPSSFSFLFSFLLFLPRF